MTRTASLLIRIAKRADGGSVLTCTRADGTVTWQRQEGAKARFFPLHDLTHYAVETTLGHRHGFYGMVADGWDLSDFGSPWPRGRIPADADPSELIVGFLDTERAAGVPGTAESFNVAAANYHAAREAKGPTCVAPIVRLTDADLDRVRERMLELFARWHALPPGDSMELQFQAGGP